MQCTEIKPEDLATLLDVSLASGQPITVDWVNRTIRVTSELKTNPKVQLSYGPLQYRDILFEIRG